MKIPIRTSILLLGLNGILGFDFLIENGHTTFASNVEVKDFQFWYNRYNFGQISNNMYQHFAKNSINYSLQNKSIIVSLDG